MKERERKPACVGRKARLRVVVVCRGCIDAVNIARVDRDKGSCEDAPGSSASASYGHLRQVAGALCFLGVEIINGRVCCSLSGALSVRLMTSAST